MVLVDTNVLVDVLTNDPQWADWSIQQLRAQSQLHDLLINAVIYAELSLTFGSVGDLDETVDGMGLILNEMPRPALFLAGKAFVRYRREGGRKNNVLADFFIGAHAAILRCPILTRDVKRYHRYFPSVVLIVPEAA
ncbi:MAG: type II toxin-antitoxin system VapC family toxin [Gammaproteobacteria bacterium]